MIRDRGSNFSAAFGAVLADAGIRTVLCSIQTPRMNAIAERWIGGCRRELLDRTLVWNQAHLRRILSDYDSHHNQHRPHRFLNGAAPLKLLSEPSRPVPHLKTRSSRRPDQRIPPGCVTWRRFWHPQVLARADLAAQRRRTMSRCQRTTVSGLTSSRSPWRGALGTTASRAASKARSPQFSRRRHGRRRCRRRADGEGSGSPPSSTHPQAGTAAARL